jgi:antitoxin component YwqK of YwqJK toxin-antitoxin module
MKKLRILGLLTVFFCCLNSVLAQKIIKAKKVKLYNGLVCNEKSKNPFTGIVTGDYLNVYGIFKSENDGTENSQYVVKVFDQAIILCFKYLDEKMFKYSELSFKYGKLDGLTAFWSNKKSNLISEINFKNGVLDGISSIWGNKGNQKFQGSYKNGIQEGLTKEWYPDGKLRLECNYINGGLEGLIKEWHINGNQKFEGSYKNEKKEGLHIYWNENGDWTSIKNYDVKGSETYLKKEDLSQEIRDMLPIKIKQRRTNYNGEVLYKNTSILFSGVYQEYYSNGKLESEYSYKNGKKEGLTKEWNLIGELKFEGSYKNGEKEGLIKEWHINGNQMFEGSYKNGKKEGLHIYWNENGDWTSIKNYDVKGSESYLKKEDLSQEIRDMLPIKIKQRRNNYNGEVLYKNTSILFSGVYQEYYSNGKLESEYNYKNGKKEGLCKEWNSNGKLESEYNYKNGKKEGLCKEWNSNEKLELECNFKKGEKDGLCKEWYSNGNQKLECNFKKGEKDSLCIVWDTYGAVNIYKYENGKSIPVLKDDLNQKLLNKLNIPSIVNFSDLQERDDIYYYKDFKTIAFSGRIKEFYANGKLKLDFNFLNGFIVLQKWYFANGLLAELADYEKREFKVYHKNGKLRYDSENKVTGSYSMSSGRYSSGINKDIYNINTSAYNRKGWHKEFYENGKLYKQFKIIESTDKYDYKVYNFDSIYKEWHSNGFQSKKFNYLNGILEGSYKEWHKNGKLEIQANYINGEKEGAYNEWFDNGRLFIQTSYVNGKKEGSYKEWHDNGRLNIQTSYVNGKKDGSYKYWNYDGDYYYTKKYRSGVEY